MSVRLARASDTADLIALVKEAHEEEPVIPVQLNEDCVFTFLLRALAKEAVIGVISNDNEIESACFLEVAKPWYSSKNIVVCHLFFSRPEYRKSTNSKVLLTWARHQVERLNCPLHIEAVAQDSAKPKLGLFERVLGSPGGVSFIHSPHLEAPVAAPDVEVQLATPEDEPYVFDAVRELGKENAAYVPDEQMAISLVRGALEGDGVIGLIRPNKDIEGIILLRLNNPWFSTDVFLDEFLAWIPTQYRKSQNAKALIQFAKRQSDRLELPLRIGIVSKIELARKLAFYKRHLGNEKVYSFLYNPTT